MPTVTCPSAINTDSQPDVSTTVSNAASGTTVIIPSTLGLPGGVTAWEKQVVINGKQIFLQGSGTSSTVFIDNTPSSGPANVGNSCIAVLNQDHLAPSTVSNFTLVQGVESVVQGTNGQIYKCIKTHIASGVGNLTGNRPTVAGSSWATFWVNTTTSGPGVPWVDGTRYTSANHPSGGHIMATSSQFVKAAWRVHDIVFTNNHGVLGATGIYAQSYGLIDNITWNIGATGSFHAIECYGEGNIDNGGFNSWAETPGLGTQRAIFIEDCTFNAPPALAGGEVLIDGFGGARIVVRNSHFVNGTLGWHGTDSGYYRSVLSGEIYNNEFTNNGAVSNRGATIRGGCGVIFGNRYFGTRKNWNGYTLQYFRASPASGSFPISGWGVCDGTRYELGGTTFQNPPPNGNRLCSTTGGFRFDDFSNGVVGPEGGGNNTYFDGPAFTATVGLGNPPVPTVIPYSYPARDQPGRDSQQVLSPWYQWDNLSGAGDPQTTLPALGVFIVLETVASGPILAQRRAELIVAENRDFFNNVNPMTDPTAAIYPYAPYPYPHNLRSTVDTLAPAAPTGVTLT